MNLDAEREKLELRAVTNYTELEADRIERRCERLAKASKHDVMLWLVRVNLYAVNGEDFEAWLEHMETCYKAVK